MRGTLSGRRQFASRGAIDQIGRWRMAIASDMLIPSKKCACASSITATASTAAAPRACSRASIGSGSPRRRSRSPTGRWSTRARPQPFSPDCFDGDENVCVDFRYSQDPRLTWWFDHHASAFQLPGDEDHFRADATGRKFYDPTAKSCTKFLADTVADQVRLRRGAAGGADRVGGDHRRRAVSRAPKMAGRAEGAGAAADDLHREQPQTGDRPSGSSATWSAARWPRSPPSPTSPDALKPLLEQHQRNIETIRTKARLEGDVAFFDLAGPGDDGVQQVHLLLPVPRGALLGGRDAGVAAPRSRSGRNPWSKVPRTHEINKICERYGGGGHPVVGAISIPRAELPRAREIAREIVAELQTRSRSRRLRLTPAPLPQAGEGEDGSGPSPASGRGCVGPTAC